MTDETYESYKNRETWAFEVNWANSEPVYRWVLGTAQDFLRHKPDAEDWEIGRYVIDKVKDEANTAVCRVRDVRYAAQQEFYRSLAIMRDDVGSWWRVDEREVGESVRDSLKQEDMYTGSAS